VLPRVRFRPGMIVRVPVDEETHTYGRMLSASPFMAFYDCRAIEELDLSVVVSRPVLFVLATEFERPIDEGRWVRLGVVPLAQADVPIPPQFMQNIGDPTDIQLIDHLGNVRAVSPDECEGLERSAVWQVEHVEERIADHYAGRVNGITQRLALKRP